jgi:hypothetical protein
VRSGVRRILGAIAAAVVGLTVGGLAPAGAQAPAAATPDAATVAAAIEQTGWYADLGANPGPDSLAALAAWVAANPHPIAYAVMAAEPPGSSQSYAYDVLDALPLGSRFQTVVVLSPDDIGIDSDYWDDGAIDRTLDASVDAIRADASTGLGQLTADLVNRPATTPGSGSVSGGDGQPDVGVFVILGLGLVGLWIVSWLVRGEQYERRGDGNEPYWDRRRRYQRYTSGSSGSRSSSSSSHRSSSSGHSHRGSGGRRL